MEYSILRTFNLIYWSSGMLLLFFTEPDFPYLDALAPFQPLAMKAIHCPIDTSLNFPQGNKLIRDLKPSILVVPEVYLQPPAICPHKTDLVIDQVSTRIFHTLIRCFLFKNFTSSRLSHMHT